MIARRIASAAARLGTAARRYRASPLEVAGRYLWLRAVRGVALGDALSMGLLDPRMPAREAARYAREDELVEALRALNPRPTDNVDDKAIFYACCRGNGIPIPRPLAIVTPPFGVTAAGAMLRTREAWQRFLAEELPDEFVVKPAKGLHGNLVEVFERRPSGFRRGACTLTVDALHRRLCADAAYGRAIVQERLRNHASLAALSGTVALQCTRIVTLITRGGEVEIPYAAQKLIGGTSDTDNYDGGTTGNLAANLDIETGVLGRAYGRGPDGIGLATYEAHPVTGQRIAGVRLPHWDAARDLVRRAALQALPLRSIGWDVALTPSGPVLVEGNTLWFCMPARGYWPDTTDLARLRRAL